MAQPKPLELATEPYPGFPTDMQAQMCALLSTTQGISVITENIFPQRYMHVAELKRMGAHVQLEGATAVIQGVEKLDRRAGDGERSARVGGAGSGGLESRRRDRSQPRLSHRSRLRTSRRKTERARRAHRARESLGDRPRGGAAHILACQAPAEHLAGCSWQPHTNRCAYATASAAHRTSSF